MSIGKTVRETNLGFFFVFDSLNNKKQLKIYDIWKQGHSKNLHCFELGKTVYDCLQMTQFLKFGHFRLRFHAHSSLLFYVCIGFF